LDGQNQDENIKIFCKIRSSKKSRFLIAKKSRFLARLINLTKSFCTVPFARLLLQGSFCKASFAKPLLQGYLLQGCLLPGSFCNAIFARLHFARLPFARLPFTRLPFARHLMQGILRRHMNTYLQLLQNKNKLFSCLIMKNKQEFNEHMY
jgi:hypothetical protein